MLAAAGGGVVLGLAVVAVASKWRGAAAAPADNAGAVAAVQPTPPGASAGGAGWSGATASRVIGAGAGVESFAGSWSGRSMSELPRSEPVQPAPPPPQSVLEAAAGTVAP